MLQKKNRNREEKQINKFGVGGRDVKVERRGEGKGRGME